MNYYSDEKDWQWLFRNAMDWDKILPLYYPSFPTEDGFNNKEEVIDFLEEILINTGAWTGTSVTDRAAALDRDGAGTVVDGRTIPGEHLQALYKEAIELEMIGLPFPQELGGMGAPTSLLLIVLAQLSRACLGSSTQLAFFTSIGEMIHRFCDHDTAHRLVPKIARGEISGSMCLTEPGCGSDLGMIKTSATPTEDGKYLLNGSKIFITNGGGGLGFVLARIKGDKEGLEGISMFLAEQEIEGKEGLNYIVAKNEEKMGMHGSFTCEVVYENSEATLVGEAGQGFKYMLHLMNEARIAVGMQALGTIEGSLGYAVKYAQEREQFGKPLSELPLMKRNLSDYTTERDAIRALLMDTISHFDIFQRLDYKKNTTNDLTKDEEVLFQDATLWTRKRTPLVKYYACEAATLLSQRAIQVLGGYGFMQEYPVERYHRDSYGPLLYEGTSQIQALMALKDIMKYAMKDPKRFFSNVLFKHPTADLLNGSNDWSKTFKSTHYRFKKKMLGLLMKCLRPEIGKLFDPKSWASDENVSELMEHAETLCQALSYMETLRVLCEHANKDQSRKDLFDRYVVLITPRLEAIYSDWSIR
ncbi:acyl-CoA dehydrogenase family protein [Halobacteriovorax sp. HLS]|uniref:acyl-CoA dehydrogenase family protein n=1 Tax=Halobacteriovorax sp. HLS TaxID=2234000 RepID=UPI000FD91F7A|nr:acyl-CoA dehydrogenase family protein [Halobacteriovorax sp. HLS]